jgi:hypothetical protein
MAVHTVDSLRKSRRGIISRLEKADRVLREMRAGNSLYLMRTAGGPIWRLSNGKYVSNTVAELVVASASVVGAGDCLFRDKALSQTFRWWRDTHTEDEFLPQLERATAISTT